MLILANSLSRPFGWLQLLPRFERQPVAKKRTPNPSVPAQPALRIQTSTDDSERPVLALCGELNRKSYLALIEQAQDLYDNGARHIQLDLSQLAKCELSGHFAIHSIVALYRGAEPMDPEMGVSGYRTMVTKNVEAGITEAVTMIRIPNSIQDSLIQARLSECLQIKQ